MLPIFQRRLLLVSRAGQFNAEQLDVLSFAGSESVMFEKMKVLKRELYDEIYEEAQNNIVSKSQFFIDVISNRIKIWKKKNNVLFL